MQRTKKVIYTEVAESIITDIQCTWIDTTSIRIGKLGRLQTCMA